MAVYRVLFRRDSSGPREPVFIEAEEVEQTKAGEDWTPGSFRFSDSGGEVVAVIPFAQVAAIVDVLAEKARPDAVLKEEEGGG